MSSASLAQALRRRCPYCGTKDVFASWGMLRAECPGCGHHYEREDGYWVGAMIVNLGIAQILFMVWFIGGLAITYPEVPWTPLLVVSAVFMFVLPIWFYPRSKTVWVWLDDKVHPYADEERHERV